MGIETHVQSRFVLSLTLTCEINYFRDRDMVCCFVFYELPRKYTYLLSFLLILLLSKWARLVVQNFQCRS